MIGSDPPLIIRGLQCMRLPQKFSLMLTHARCPPTFTRRTSFINSYWIALTPEKMQPSIIFSTEHNTCLKLKGLLETETDIMPDRPFDLLEFASGYGCVTRHFKNTMPNARVVASDIHPQAMDFVESHLAVVRLCPTRTHEVLTWADNMT